MQVRLQAGLDVVLAERRSGLPEVLGVGAQHGGLPPGQPGPRHQRVEPVRLGLARPDRGERTLEQPLAVRRAEGAACLGRPGVGTEPEVVDEGVATPSCRSIVYGRSSTTSTPSRCSTGQHLGQGDRAAEAEHLEAALVRPGAQRGVEVQRHGAVLAEALDLADVGDRRARRELLLVALGERLGVAPLQDRGALLAALVDQGVVEVVGPVARRLDEAGLERAASTSGSGSPGATRTTKWSRASTDSDTRAV